MSLEPPLRRRRAPIAERTSDLTRMRGLAVAAIVAALAAVAATLALSNRDALRGTPGPLARPHETAGVTCAACHDAPAMAEACTGCHGPHPSTRAAHRKAAPACTACHTAHGGGGVAITAGAAVRYGAGTEVPAGETAHHSTATVSIPLVEARACARCHDLASPRDPASRCLVAGQDALGDARPTVCFDEHRPVRDATGAISPRAAAWDAARDVASAVPMAPSSPVSQRSPWWWIAGALAAGAALWWTTARLARRRSRASSALTPRASTASNASAASTASNASNASGAPDRSSKLRLPVIDAATCLGCYACVDACPYDVLEIAKYVAFVARPADCCGLILCEQKCPNGSLAIAFVDGAGPRAIEVEPSLESRSVPGLYIAGDLGGQPLIRTALDQGARAVRAIAERPRGDHALDLLIVGAGPAGLAATLEAQALGLRSLTLEQATFADSIRSFPRGKLVIDPDLPNTSRLWLAEATKEELLARWTQAVRTARPAIDEGRRVTRIARTPTGFAVDDVDHTGAARTHTATHVLLAIGRRGTPRRLAADVPPAWAPHVHYSLADARSFAHRRVLVVGLGDVAMEAAIALSRQPGTQVTLAARAADFQRGKARNIAEVRRRVASGSLTIAWRAEVRAFGTGRVALTTGHDVACDSVFVMIGAIPSEDLLRSTGLLVESHRKEHVNQPGPETEGAGGASHSSARGGRP